MKRILLCIALIASYSYVSAQCEVAYSTTITPSTGSADGSIFVSVTNNNGDPVNYYLSTGASSSLDDETHEFTGLNNGTYYLTVYDNTWSCSNTSEEIVPLACDLSYQTTVTPSTGGSNGQIYVSLTNYSTDPVKYYLSGVDTSAQVSTFTHTFSGLDNDTFNLIVHDYGWGCSDSTTVILTAPSYVFWVDTVFQEARVNDGRMEDGLYMKLRGGEKFSTTGALTSGVHYSASGMPDGLSAFAYVYDDTTAVFRLQNNATDHYDMHDDNSVVFTLMDDALAGGDASAVVNSSVSNLSVNFNDQGYIEWQGSLFTEAAADDGSIKDTITAIVHGNRYKPENGLWPDSYISSANVPYGLTVTVYGVDDTTALISLKGNADAHAATDSINNLALFFNEYSFTSDTNEIGNVYKNDFTVRFNSEADTSGGGGDTTTADTCIKLQLNVYAPDSVLLTDTNITFLIFNYMTGGLGLLADSVVNSATGGFMASLSAGSYYVKAQLRASLTGYPDALSTFYGNKAAAIEQDTLELVCTDDTVVNIYIEPIAAYTAGAHSLTGTLEEAPAKKSALAFKVVNAAGEPVPGAEIILEEEPDDNPIGFGISNDTGGFVFSGLQADSFVVNSGIENMSFVEEGVRITEDGGIVLSNGSVVSQINILVSADSGGTTLDTNGVSIDTTAGNDTTGLSGFSSIVPYIKAYPVPVSDQLSIEYQLAIGAEVAFSLYDAQGRHLQNWFKARLEAGNYRFVRSLTGLPSGAYFIRAGFNQEYKTLKIIKQDP